MPDLQLYNSLTRKKEVFKPIDPGHVRLYACGPTVYSYAHIGNARMAVVFDLLSRLLRTLYPKVTYVSNITDVDDKIMTAAKETGKSIAHITEKYEHIYNEDMSALGCVDPDVQPRATEHISEMIALIETLIAKEHAYEAREHVLFHVPSFPAYGGLSGRSPEEQIAGARVEVSPYKKDPADFVLWKPSKEDEPGWDSPWGRGRPGWHIECSAMAEKHLGLPFDIHGGGADLKFPHHENEIAQSCCAHDAENDLSAFAHTWVHNGFVTVEGEKMSKSLGNISLVHNLIKNYRGEVLRLALLRTHYRQPLDWSKNLLKTTQSFLNTFYRTLYDLEKTENVETEIPSKILNHFYDDLNTPGIFGDIKKIERDAAAATDIKDKIRLKGQLLACGKLLGILQQNPAEWLGYNFTIQETVAATDSMVAEVISDPNSLNYFLQEREEARKNKNFRRADEIRDELAARGFAIEDTAEGPKLRKIS